MITEQETRSLQDIVGREWVLKRVAPGPGAEAFLMVRYALARDEVWAKAGHVVAWDQLPQPAGPPEPALALASMPPLQLDESGPTLSVKGEGFSVAVGRASGALESFRHDGRELVSSPLVPNFWRVPLDNDIGFLLLNDMPRRLAAWKTAGPQRRTGAVRAERLSPQAVRITAEATLPAAWSAVRRDLHRLRQRRRGRRGIKPVKLQGPERGLLQDPPDSGVRAALEKLAAQQAGQGPRVQEG